MLTAVITLGLLAVMLIAALALTVKFFVAERSETDAAMSLERIAWVEERRELLNRIQRPEYVPATPITDWAVPELEDDELELVGTVQEPADA